MARPGVTYQDVVTAANQVKGEGKNVTIENVRAVLGTGSIGTINNHLRRWKDNQNTTQRLAAEKEIPEELVSVLKGLWIKVIEESSHKITVIEEAYQTEISEQKTELEKYKTNNQRWQQLFNQWQQEKSKLANDQLTLEQALDFNQKENTTLQTKVDNLLSQIQDKQERIEELNRLHKQSQNNLEHYRESTREQRLIEQQQFDQQRQQLQAEIKQQAEQLQSQREKSVLLLQQQQTLQQSYVMLEKTHVEIESLVQQIKFKLDEAEKAKNESLLKYSHLEFQYKESQAALKEKTDALIESQMTGKVLSQQLIESKQALKELHDQHKLLGHDKWILAEEKAELIGQLKQMQKMITA